MYYICIYRGIIYNSIHDFELLQGQTRGGTVISKLPYKYVYSIVQCYITTIYIYIYA